MNINNMLEMLNDNPICYFMIGMLCGFLLRGFILHRFSTDSRNKKSGRYHNQKTHSAAKRSQTIVNVNEPSFGWAEAAIKTVTNQKYNSNTSLEKSVTEI